MVGGLGFIGNAGDQLAFDYGAQTVNFCIGLDKAEAKMILNDIQMYSPRIVQKG